MKPYFQDDAVQIKDYTVRQIPNAQTHEWLMKKHYAHRIPQIQYAFGLYDNVNILKGICTFGLPANYMEVEAWKPFPLLELNRLVVNDGEPKNACSYFVSNSISKLPSPLVIISYSDLNMGHHGYIYQACNFIYTGLGGEKIYKLPDGRVIPRRHHEEFKTEITVEPNLKKARYYYFRGTKREIKEITSLLRYKKLPYPKGDNQRYDASYEPPTQGVLV